MTTQDPFAADRAKLRRNILLGTAAIVVVVATLLVVRWARSTDRVMDRHRIEIQTIRDRYCKILEKEKATAPASRTALERGPQTLDLVVPGPFYFEDLVLPEKPGTLDKIQLEDLEAVCADKTTAGERSVRSLFANIVEPNQYLRAHYTQDGLTRAINGAKGIDHLLVVRLGEMTASVAVGEKGLAPGRYKAQASLWRLSDATHVDSVDVAGHASGIEYVEKGHEEIQLKIKTDEALEDDIARAFGKHGIAMKLHY